VCIALCTIVAHNIAQNRPDSFPPYPPDDHHSSDDVYLREGVCVIWSELTPLVQIFIYYRPVFQSQHYKHAEYNRIIKIMTMAGRFYVTATAISLMAAS